MLIVIYSGPNGAGKSTLFSILEKKLGLPFINPDRIAQGKYNQIENEEDRYKKYALPEAEIIRKKLVENGIDFSFETVLSHPSKIQELKEAKEKGYQIHCIYIGTNDPSINVERVAKRVLNGGHSVPEDKIIDRYYRSLDNLPELLNLSSEAVVLDNSIDLTKILLKYEDKYYLLGDGEVPNWIKKSVIEPLTKKGYLKEYPSYYIEQPDENSLLGVVGNALEDNDKGFCQGIKSWKREIAEIRSKKNQVGEVSEKNTDERLR